MADNSSSNCFDGGSDTSTDSICSPSGASTGNGAGNDPDDVRDNAHHEASFDARLPERATAAP